MDQWILDIVKNGIKLQFEKVPKESGPKETIFISQEKKLCILDEVGKLLGKNAIELVPLDQVGRGYYSTFFVVPKKDGGLRPILNLRQLNTHLIIPHFKMETLRSIMKSLVPGDWAFSVDLTDAYLHLCGSSTVSEVSQVLCTRNSLPVQSNAFRSCDSSTFIYKGDVDSRELPPKTANIHSHVSGRLASETSRPHFFAHSTQNHDHRSSSTVRFADKSREVTIEPNANIGVFGSIFQSEGRDNLSDRNQIFKSSTGDFTINYNGQCSSSQIPATARFDGSMHRFSSPCTTCILLKYTVFLSFSCVLTRTVLKQFFI